MKTIAFMHDQGSWRTVWRRTLAVALLLQAVVAFAQPSDEWAEWNYQWGQLAITVRSNAGVYSPAMQALVANNRAARVELRPDALMHLTRTFFVMTSASQADQTFEFIEPLAKKWGAGHSLPIIAAVAIENLQRPMPSLFGGPVAATTAQLKPVAAGGLDPTQPGRLRIVVYGQPASYRRAAEQVAHASAKAYFDASRNEVGLLLDMATFRRLYANVDAVPGRHPATLSAFIAYATDAFSEDSSHELAHVYQQQSRRPAYALPAIREGEAEVQGMVRRRNGLVFNFLYNTPEAWQRGRFDPDVLQNRLSVLRARGRPMHPFEVDRHANLKRLSKSGRALRVSDLLAMDSPSFFAGSVAEVEARYAQSWALCLQAIREQPFGEMLGRAIGARLARAPQFELEQQLEVEHARFLNDPYELVATKEKVRADAERFYAIDPVFAGAFYAWLHQVDPGDMTALVYLGDSLFKGRNLHAALRYYEAAGQLEPSSALPPMRVGDVLSASGDHEGALRWWKAAATSLAKGDGETVYRKLALEHTDPDTPAQAASSVPAPAEALAAALGQLMQPQTDLWLGFAEYTGARRLCSQRVIGTRGEVLDWRSFATTDEIVQVERFYVERGLKDAERSGAEVLFRQGTDRVLTLHPASNPQPPSCEQKPRDGEKTVIVVSTMRG